MVTRLAIDRLRAAHHRREYVGPWLPEPVATGPTAGDPHERAEQAELLATATLQLMERLDPVERAVFVLRAAFDVPYAEISEIVERDVAHCRQLYRRAARRVAEGQRRFQPSRHEHAALLERFLRAARHGNLAELNDTLHDDVIAWSDGGGKVRSARHPVRGAERVARFFAGIYGRGEPVRVRAVEINGTPGAVVSDSGRVHVLTFAVRDGKVSGVYLVANPDKTAAIRHMTD